MPRRIHAFSTLVLLATVATTTPSSSVAQGIGILQDLDKCQIDVRPNPRTTDEVSVRQLDNKSAETIVEFRVDTDVEVVLGDETGKQWAKLNQREYVYELQLTNWNTGNAIQGKLIQVGRTSNGTEHRKQLYPNMGTSSVTTIGKYKRATTYLDPISQPTESIIYSGDSRARKTQLLTFRRDGRQVSFTLYSTATP